MQKTSVDWLNQFDERTLVSSSKMCQFYSNFSSDQFVRSVRVFSLWLCAVDYYPLGAPFMLVYFILI